ncbi:unnamed protein product [Soboliphyme baturini]|uniref:PH domain-containing protein n=1 Tax=Soboliphyme baturini TaxID=241478 RepID=A0A183J6N4_9BILA|nr:unnamed protein product [Soboliphyme baturini]
MFQLNQLMNEQRSLIESMMNLSLTGAKVDSSNLSRRLPESRNVTHQLMERVQGCCHLPENSNRSILIESDLTKLNPDTMIPCQQVHAFLLPDGLMLTSFMPQKIGPLRYKFDALFSLENLAYINVKDGEGYKNVFKLLVFPEQLYFSCEDSLTKKKWSDSIEHAKKQMLRQGSLMRQATIRMKNERIRRSLQKSTDDPGIVLTKLKNCCDRVDH